MPSDSTSSSSGPAPAGPDPEPESKGANGTDGAAFETGSHETAASEARQRPSGKYLLTLALGAVGVVYGDIGTSPLYAMRECFAGHVPLPVTRENVLGVLSLMVWSLALIVTVKYVAFVMRADNHGEGGILALMSLVQGAKPRGAKLQAAMVLVAIVGAALLYGDGVITPAISVLSAVEGVAVFQPQFEPFIVPLALAVLAGLFLLQRRGTSGIGAIFGPITLLWFIVLAGLGIGGILHAPSVLLSVNPYYGAVFFLHHGWHAFWILGAVFLVVTGSEALYADMGHFGRRPIRLTWFAVVAPALLLNYWGQGALLLEDAAAVKNPFYLLAPSWGLLPLIALATTAACVASQAVISGAFSITRQAVQMGFCPRLEIVHTSEREIGQIYIPAVNWALFVTVILLVLGFRTSSGLAAAYGIAVASTMVLTGLLMFFAAKDLWHWRTAVAALVFGAFLVVDVSFLTANALKIADGGWFPLVFALGIVVLMTTWKRGRAILAERLREGTLPMEVFLKGLADHQTPRVPGTAVFMTGNPHGTPPALLHNLKHNKVLHERVVLLTVETAELPSVPEKDRLELSPLEGNFFRVVARYGFMQTPSMPELLSRLAKRGLKLKMMETSFFLGRETLIPSKKRGMTLWRKALFGWMSKNARTATNYFNLPPNRVVELGAQIEL